MKWRFLSQVNWERKQKTSSEIYEIFSCIERLQRVLIHLEIFLKSLFCLFSKDTKQNNFATVELGFIFLWENSLFYFFFSSPSPMNIKYVAGLYLSPLLCTHFPSTQAFMSQKDFKIRFSFFPFSSSGQWNQTNLNWGALKQIFQRSSRELLPFRMNSRLKSFFLLFFHHRDFWHGYVLSHFVVPSKKLNSWK